MNAPVTALGSIHPFANPMRRIEVPAGLTIREIVDIALIGEAHRDELDAGLIASVGDQAIPREFWERVRPKPGTVVVFRATVGEFGRQLATIAIAISALVLAPVLAPALAGALGGAISVGAAQAILGGAITIGGQLLVNALFPIRPAALGRDKERTLPSIAGARNEATPWEVVPVVLGRHRLAPRYGARPYTERVGQDQYLRLLFVAGYGPLDLSDFRIGETGLDEFDGVTTEIREGYDSDDTIRKFPAQAYEDQLAITLSSDDGWHTRTTHADADELSIDLLAPEGIYEYEEDSGKYKNRPVTVNVEYRLAGSGGSWTAIGDVVFKRSKRPVRLGASAEVARGQYDVRVRKQTNDDDDSNVADTVVWTALRSFTNDNPIAFPKKLAIVALRIRATDQLNGVVDTFNLIAESRVKAFNGSSWVSGQPSRNPADLFRHVLQGGANARPVADSRIDLDNLEAWWAYCVANGLHCDLVIAEKRSVYDTLADVAAAGRATPAFRDGRWGVVFNESSDDVVWHFTPRNSWGFASEPVYRELPHALRARFINANRDYAEDERIIYRDGFSKTNATLFERVEFPGVTSPSAVWKAGRFQLAQAELRREVYTFSVDVEGLRVTRGDRVRVSHDVPLWGVAAARVKAVAGQVVTLDARAILVEGASYAVRFRLADGGTLLRTVVNTATETEVITLHGSGDVPAAGDLASLGEVGEETVVLRVLEVRPQADLTFQLTCVDDAPGIFDADAGEVPAYDPGITLPPDPFTLRPEALSAAERIAGYGITAKSVIDLVWTVARVGRAIAFEVQARDVDAGGPWQLALSAPAPQLAATVEDLEEGYWQFRVRTLFDDGTASGWTESAVIETRGLLNRPADVSGFAISSIGDVSTLTWSAVATANLSHYVIKFSGETDGSATWGTATLLVPSVYGTSIQVPARAGAYLIKAATFQGVESEAAAVVITTVSGILSLNVVELIEEEPDFAGIHDNTEDDAGVLTLATDGDFYVTAGTYYFAHALDLGDVYTCRLSAEITAFGSSIGNTIDKWTSLAEVEALDIADPSGWSVEIYYRITDDDPTTDLSADSTAITADSTAVTADQTIAGAAPSWSDWRPLIVGDVAFRAIEFKAGLTGTPAVSPAVSRLAVSVDMPDRVEGARNVVSLAGSVVSIAFDPPFREEPAIAATGQNLATGDYYQITNKTAAGFDIRFFAAGGTGVARTFDWIAKGYGRIVA